MADRRRHARYCSGSCRAEASRLRRILSGAEPDGFASIAARVDAIARKRTDDGSARYSAQQISAPAPLERPGA